MKMLCTTTSLVLAAAAAMPAAAAVLFSQAPSLADNAVINATQGQAALVAEQFSFNGTGRQLVWWGTEAAAFRVELYGLANGARLIDTTQVTAEATSLLIDIDEVATPVWRFSIDLGDLAGGHYTLALRETAADAAGRSWYALRGQGGDGSSFSGWRARWQTTQGFDLALQVNGEPQRSVPAPATAGLVALGVVMALGALGALGPLRLGAATPRRRRR